MEPINIICPNFGPLAVVGDRLHDGYDFVVRSNSRSDTLDYLIFLDSRGISRGFEGSIADKLITQIAQGGGTYLLLCRPLELTTWATLINFIVINKLNLSKIVTNMGFVDFTPKKLSTLQDAVQQVDFFIGKDVANSCFVQSFESSSGEMIPLYSMCYGDTYRKSIETIAKRLPTLIVNTPLVDDGIRIDRKRPHAFFSALANSNEFNRSINGAQVVDLPHFDETLTYDAVHYPTLGNEVIFDSIKDYI